MTDQEKTISSQKDLNVHGSTIDLPGIDEEKATGPMPDDALVDGKNETMDRGELRNILENHDHQPNGRNLEQYDTGRTDLLPQEKRTDLSDTAHPQPKQVAEVKETNKQKRLLVLAVPIAILLLIVIIIIIVVSQNSSKPVIDAVEDSLAGDREERSKQLDLNMNNLIRLADKPNSDLYEADSYYSRFQYILPDEYLAAGNVRLVGYEAWYDSYNIEGMQFTFNNGVEDKSTSVFGLTKDRRGTPVESVQVTLDEPARSVEYLMVNTKLTVDQDKTSGWYVVNFTVNDSNQAGFDDSKYPLEKAIRNPMSSDIDPSQRIVGVYGYTRKSYGTLRSIGLIVASGPEAGDQ